MNASQLTAKWQKFWNPSSVTASAANDSRQARNDTRPSKTVEATQLTTSTVPLEGTDIVRVDPAVNAEMSPLLRLPAELRNQIFCYMDYSSYVIQVLSLSKTEYNALDEKGTPLIHNPYPNDQIWFRIEKAADEEFSLDKPNIDTRRKRCASILGLFALPYVCQQIRAETMLMYFEGPFFAFSDRRYNYAKAFPSFLKSLSPREKAAVRSIHWPLRQAREFYHRSQNEKPMEAPDQAFVNELRKLPNLERVVLQYLATDVGGLRLTGSDETELEALMEDMAVGERYTVERVFRRELAVRGMMWQISHKDGVNIQCEKRRVAF